MDRPVWHEDELDRPSNRPRHGRYGDTDTPLRHAKPLGAGEPRQQLHHHHLHGDRHGDDAQEHPVPEHAGEDVLPLDLPGVELVEHLAEHEGVEDHGAVGLLVDAEDVAAAVLERQQHGHLERGLRGEVAPHGVADERRRAADGRAPHERLGGLVRRQRQRAHGVHDQVHPQQLHRRQRHLARGQRRHEVDDQRRDVDGELELDELLDVVEDAAAPPGGRHHRVEVVVHDHDVGALLGDLGALDTHGQPDVGLLERRRVVGAVAGDRDHVALLLQALYQHQLVHGQRPRHHADAVHDLQLLLRRHGAELVPLDDNTIAIVVRDDAALLGNGTGRENVVAGDHLDRDTRLRAGLNGGPDLWTAGILQTDEAQQCQVLIIDLGVLSVDLLVSECDAPKAACRHVADDLLEVPPLLAAELARRAVRADIRRAARQDHLGGTFPVRGHRAGRIVPDQYAAALLVGVEGLDVQHLAAPLQRVGVHSQLRHGPRQQRLLRRAPRYLRRRDVVRLVHAPRGVEPCPLAQQADDAAVDRSHRLGPVGADPELGYLHLVQRKRPCLVGADGGDGAHGLTRRERAHQRVLLDHPLHGECQRQGDGERQTLRDGDDDDGDRLLEDPDKRAEDGVEGNVLLVEQGFALLIPGAAGEVPRCEHGENEHRHGDADLADAGGEALEALLQRRRLGLLPGDAAHHLAPRSVRADGRDDHLTVAVDDLHAGGQEGALLGVDVHRVGLAGHAGLVYLQRVPLQEHAIGGHDVADLEHHDVAYDDVEDGDLLPPPAAHDGDRDVVGLTGEPVEALGLAVIADRGHRRDEEHGEEDADTIVPAVLEAVLLDAEPQGHGGADEQHDEEDVAERVPHVSPEPFGLPPRVRVGAERLAAAEHVGLVAADAGLRAGCQRGGDPGAAAEAAEAVVALLLDQALEVLVVGRDREFHRRGAGGRGRAGSVRVSIFVVDLDGDVGARAAQDVGGQEREAGEPVAGPDDVGGLPPLLHPPHGIRRGPAHGDQVVGGAVHACHTNRAQQKRRRLRFEKRKEYAEAEESTESWIKDQLPRLHTR
jgi:hypothetical protein